MTEKTEQMAVGLVDTVPALEEKLAALRTAQAKFATYTQEQVDCIFRAAALAANQARIPLARWQWQKQAWALWKTRSSRTTMQRNISITLTRIPRLAVS